MRPTYLLSLLATLALLLGIAPTVHTVEPLNTLNDAESTELPPRSAFSVSSAPSAIQSPASNWQIEYVDCLKQIGPLTDRSLRLGGDGRPHIAYGGNPLYYAWHDGEQWHIEMVDDTPGAGEYISLALDASTDRPNISYCLSDSVPCDVLKYAWYDGTTWHIETVDTEGGWHSSLALDTQDNPHISYRVNDELRHGWHDGKNWYVEIVDNQMGGMPPSMGASTSLELDAQGNPHISYWDNDGLRYARYDGAAWHIETVCTGDGSWGPLDTSLALDAVDRPHIGFANWEYLRYAWYDGTVWHIEEVETSGGAWNNGWILYTSLALDELGRPHVSHYHSGDLKYAWHNGLDWQIETVDGGSNTSLALDETNHPHISYTISSSDETCLKYAVGDPAPTLLLDKQAIPDVLYANGTLTYTLSFFGRGSNAHLWDPLPEHVDYISDSITSTLTPLAIYSPTARAILWQGTVPTNTASLIQFQTTLCITGTGTLSAPLAITNTAWLSDTENNRSISATASITVTPGLLFLDKQVTPKGELRNSDTLTYTLTFSGSGQIARLRDPLPTNACYITDSITSTFTPPAVYSSTARAIIWQGTLSTDTVQVVRFQVTSHITGTGTLVTPIPIANTAWLTVTEGIENGINVSATASNTVIPGSLFLDKHATPTDGLHNNDTLTYTLIFSGSGQIARLWDPLPANVYYITDSITSTLTPPAVYSPTVQAIIWKGTLPTDTARVRFLVTPGISGTEPLSLSQPIVNTAWLTVTAGVESGRSISATTIVNGWHLYLPAVLHRQPP